MGVNEENPSDEEAKKQLEMLALEQKMAFLVLNPILLVRLVRFQARVRGVVTRKMLLEGRHPRVTKQMIWRAKVRILASSTVEALGSKTSLATQPPTSLLTTQGKLTTTEDKIAAERKKVNEVIPNYPQPQHHPQPQLQPQPQPQPQIQPQTRPTTITSATIPHPENPYSKDSFAQCSLGSNKVPYTSSSELPTASAGTYEEMVFLLEQKGTNPSYTQTVEDTWLTRSRQRREWFRQRNEELKDRLQKVRQENAERGRALRDNRGRALPTNFPVYHPDPPTGGGAADPSGGITTDLRTQLKLAELRGEERAKESLVGLEQQVQRELSELRELKDQQRRLIQMYRANPSADAVATLAPHLIQTGLGYNSTIHNPMLGAQSGMGSSPAASGTAIGASAQRWKATPGDLSTGMGNAFYPAADTTSSNSSIPNLPPVPQQGRVSSVLSSYLP